VVDEHVEPTPLLAVEVVEDSTAAASNLTVALAALVLSRARAHLRLGESEGGTNEVTQPAPAGDP
jgi:hypothetical protein